MEHLSIGLIAAARQSMDDAAKTRAITTDEAAIRGLRLGVQIFSATELGGHILFVDAAGEISYLKLMPASRSWLLWHRWREQTDVLPAEPFDLDLDDVLYASIAAAAVVLGYTETDVINRLLQVGCLVDLRLAGGSLAWMHDSSGKAVGPVEPPD